MNKKGQMVPMPIIINHKTEVKTCPHCHKVIKEDEEPVTGKEVLFIVSIVLAGAWFVMTLLIWLTSSDTLLSTVIMQWKWVSGLRLW